LCLGVFARRLEKKSVVEAPVIKKLKKTHGTYQDRVIFTHSTAGQRIAFYPENTGNIQQCADFLEPFDSFRYSGCWQSYRKRPEPMIRHWISAGRPWPMALKTGPEQDLKYGSED